MDEFSGHVEVENLGDSPLNLTTVVIESGESEIISPETFKRNERTIRSHEDEGTVEFEVLDYRKAG